MVIGRCPTRSHHHRPISAVSLVHHVSAALSSSTSSRAPAVIAPEASLLLLVVVGAIPCFVAFFTTPEALPLGLVEHRLEAVLGHMIFSSAIAAPHLPLATASRWGPGSGPGGVPAASHVPAHAHRPFVAAGPHRSKNLIPDGFGKHGQIHTADWYLCGNSIFCFLIVARCTCKVPGRSRR